MVIISTLRFIIEIRVRRLENYSPELRAPLPKFPFQISTNNRVSVCRPSSENTIYDRKCRECFENCMNVWVPFLHRFRKWLLELEHECIKRASCQQRINFLLSQASNVSCSDARELKATNLQFCVTCLLGKK